MHFALLSALQVQDISIAENGLDKEQKDLIGMTDRFLDLPCQTIYPLKWGKTFTLNLRKKNCFEEQLACNSGPIVKLPLFTRIVDWWGLAIVFEEVLTTSDDLDSAKLDDEFLAS